MERTDLNNNVSQFLLNTVQALSIAVDRGFMKREHAGAIWKKLVTSSGLDVKEKEVKNDGVAEKS
jgi:hypothetical protein